MNSNHLETGIDYNETPPGKILRGSPEYFEAIDSTESPNNGPLYIMMNLETKCSYKCPKCALPGYRRDMGKPLNLEQRKEALAKARQIGIKELVIVGAGEPTEHFEGITRDIIKTAHSEGLGTIMFTTASHLTRSQAEFFRDHDVSIFVSLDAIDPNTYQELTGTGNLDHVLDNVQTLREVYSQGGETLNGKQVVRLGINVTVVKQNRNQLDALKRFAGDDMQFIANSPIRRGRFGNRAIWERLVGNYHESLQRIAQSASETGGHSSINEGVCGYFNRGISIDVDGQFLSCGYASETAHSIGRFTDETTPSELEEHYRTVRAKFRRFAQQTGIVPSCPLRSDTYQHFLEEIKK